MDIKSHEVVGSGCSSMSALVCIKLGLDDSGVHTHIPYFLLHRFPETINAVLLTRPLLMEHTYHKVTGWIRSERNSLMLYFFLAVTQSEEWRKNAPVLSSAQRLHRHFQHDRFRTSSSPPLSFVLKSCLHANDACVSERCP
jgi:hypothetical protein